VEESKLRYDRHNIATLSPGGGICADITVPEPEERDSKHLDFPNREAISRLVGNRTMLTS
jgi:hypothetical protein